MEIIQCTTKEQLAQLAQLANTIWHEYFTSIISEEQIEYMIEKFQSFEAIQKAMKEEGYIYFLGYEEDMLVGYCGVKPEETRVFLSKLYLHKDQRGKGLASILLKKAIAFAKEQQKTAIYLTCNKYNQHSLDVYYGKGFKTIDSVQSDIGDGFIMDDYILQLELVK